MKYLLVILLLVGNYAYSQNQWELQHPHPSPQDNNVVLAFDSLHIILGGSSNTLFESKNGGRSWDRIELFKDNPYINFTTGFYNNGSDAWLCGSREAITYTGDIGKSWEVQNRQDSTINVFQDIDFVDTKNGWAVSDTIIQFYFASVKRSYYRSKFWRTTDGGKNWKQTFLADYKHIRAISFRDSLNGWACGDSATVLSTTDGGITWKSIEVPEKGQTTIYDIDCSSSGRVILTAYASTLCSTDNGSSWTRDSINKGTYITFRDNLGILVPGTSNARFIYRSEDDGISWQKVSIADDALPNFSSYKSTTLKKASFAPDGSIWIHGNAGILIRSIDNGKSWEPIVRNIENMLAINFPDDKNGWAIGEGSMLLRTTDSGKNWTRKGKKTDSIFYHAVHFLNSQNGWMIQSKNGKRSLLQTNDGGDSWTAISVDSTMIIEQIRFFTKDIAVARINNNGQFFMGRSENGGRNWELTLPTNVLYNFYFLNEQLGWAAGKEIYTTRNGGKSWSQLRYPDATLNASFFDVSFLDSLHGWVAGSGFKNSKTVANLYYTSDGGRSWEDRADTNRFKGGQVTSVEFIDSLRGVIIYGLGIQETKDGGKTWNYAASDIPTGGALMLYLERHDKNIWAIGNNGMVLQKSFDTSTTKVENEVIYSFLAYSIYPNPAKGHFIFRSILHSPPDKILNIYDSQGELVSCINPESFVPDPKGGWKAEINVRSLSPGVYIIDTPHGGVKFVLDK